LHLRYNPPWVPSNLQRATLLRCIFDPTQFLLVANLKARRRCGFDPNCQPVRLTSHSADYRQNGVVERGARCSPWRGRAGRAVQPVAWSSGARGAARGVVERGARCSPWRGRAGRAVQSVAWSSGARGAARGVVERGARCSPWRGRAGRAVPCYLFPRASNGRGETQQNFKITYSKRNNIS